MSKLKATNVAVVGLALLVNQGCSSTHSSVEQLSDNTFEITVSGLSKDGKVVLERHVLNKASELCEPNKYKFKATGLGQKISFSGMTNAPSNGTWYGNHSNSIQAVATVVCVDAQ